jgi:glycosyltransferase involved in cell wall biosynthesis
MTVSNDSFSLSVVIPAFNEAANVATTVQEALHQLCANPQHRVEMILVDDGSTDETSQEMISLARTFPNVRIVSHEVNMGLGAAIYSGMTAASGDWISWLPADGQIPPDNIDLLAQVVDDSTIAILLRPDQQRSIGRRILTALFHVVVRVALSDRYRRYSGVFLVPRHRVTSLKLVANTAVQNLAVVESCRLEGAQVVSVEGTLRPRASGVSKVANAKTSLQTLMETLSMRRKLVEVQEVGRKKI